MRTKNIKSLANFGFIQSTMNRNIQKKTQEVKKTSVLAKKAKELIKKNLHFLMKGKFPHQQLQRPLLKVSAEYDHKNPRLPSNEQEDNETHLTLEQALTREYALHSSISWRASLQHGLARPVDCVPRSWKQATHPLYFKSYNPSKRQLQFQELIYEIILSEQSYLDDLILSHKVFIFPINRRSFGVLTCIFFRYSSRTALNGQVCLLQLNVYLRT
jgi:hypothetical protein